MKSGYPTRLIAILLALVTLGIIGSGCGELFPGPQLRSTHRRRRPDRNHGWPSGLLVPPGTPPSRAGIHEGDVVTAINGQPTPNLADAIRAIYRSGVLSTAKYTV